MLVLLASLLGCTPADSAVTTAPAAAGIRVQLRLPSDLSTAAALDLALLEATLADFDDIVVVIDQPAVVDADTPIAASWRGTVAAHVDHVSLELCDARRCRTHRGPNRRVSLARQLGANKRTAWVVPEGEAASRAGHAARVLYGFRSVRERDVGTPRDPVVVALEGTPNALVHWIHGRREARSGRDASAAWAFAAVVRLRDTPRSRLQSAFAWHQAGWTDAAFELVRDVQTDDARALGPMARISAARGRTLLAEAWLARLPDRPTTHGLAYTILPTTDHLVRWAASNPTDPELRQAQIRRALERQEVDSLLAATPSLVTHRKTLRTAAELADALDQAERLTDDVARAQNAFTSARRRGRVPCDSPVRVEGVAARSGLERLGPLRDDVNQRWPWLADAPPVLQPSVAWLGDRVTAMERQVADLARVQTSVVEARRCPGG